MGKTAFIFPGQGAQKAGMGMGAYAASKAGVARLTEALAEEVKDRGVRDSALITRYSVIAGIIAAIGLSLVYLALFYLGATSQGIAGDAQNGVQILTAYVQHTFGGAGSFLLAALISLGLPRHQPPVSSLHGDAR